ncbi:hypothetical protein [Urbifossiella limnaea]|uniref:Uncharacterized protein n=1 Tax=Urbifossiella limnaea TaxID=2528023 RepID=A0A517XPB5_9BACT|nr:hypothetical protein [Urbifossiella limnaea]QDU19349.1 hypothetical protein ETAA1_12560 [Urbifossiella limnaea]
MPQPVVAVHDPAAPVPADVFPLLADRPAIGGAPTVYVCRDAVRAAGRGGSRARVAVGGG